MTHSSEKLIEDKKNARLAAKRIQASCNKIDTAVILGSGLGSLTELLTDPICIPYHELPGFPAISITGHAGELHLGQIGKQQVALLSGRQHYYEHAQVTGMRSALLALRESGCNTMVVTNAAGAIHDQLGPGDVLLINDHISAFVGQSPLFGLTGNDRFVNMRNAYDADLRSRIQRIASELGSPLIEGSYVWFNGPQFETEAEIQMFRQLNFAAVGMSTVPEVILCRWLNMQVIGLANITNKACGLGDETLSHEQTMAMASIGAGKINDILVKFFATTDG